jgi:hypothetical protein
MSRWGGTHLFRTSVQIPKTSRQESNRSRTSRHWRASRPRESGHGRGRNEVIYVHPHKATLNGNVKF